MQQSDFLLLFDTFTAIVWFKNDFSFCRLITSLSDCPHPGLTKRLQKKLSSHGVKLSLPGLQGESERPLPSPEPSQPGLVRLLALLCSLELNGNLQSELEQTVEKERTCLLQDGLLQGLLDSPALRHCLDTTLENSTPGKIKILEVRRKTRFHQR